MIKTLCLIVLSVFAVGCSSLNLQKPAVDVTGMSVADVNANGFTMNFGVDLKNPNSVALPLTDADYKIALSGVNVAEGKASENGNIPANGTKSVTLPVTLTYDSLLTAEKAIAATRGNVPYNLDGGLSFNSGTPMLASMRVPVQYNGTLQLKEVLTNPRALLSSPAAQRLARQLMGSLFR